MSWASRRRMMYGGGAILVLAAIVAIPLFKFLYHAPSCFDGKQNQGETAIDLGGPCVALDARSLAPEAIAWVRVFPIRMGEYAATAYIQNPNRTAAALSVPYTFSFYDSDNVLVAERTGSVSIMPGGITPVFAGPIQSGSRMIARAFLAFTGPRNWVRAGNPASALINSNIAVTNSATPKVSVTVTNTDVVPRQNVTYVATVFDSAGNAIASSKTVIPSIDGGASKDLVFSWPQAFPAQPARVDVIPVTEPSVQ